MWVGNVVADRFVIERPIGSGGMGSVFHATDRVAGVPVAVKVLELASEGAVERFRREARVLSELSHPGVVRYIAHGETEARESFLVMELLEGEDLAKRLARGGLSVEESLAVVRRAAEALGFAHAAGIVHRDVKPSNLFLVGGDAQRVKVLDFGIARANLQTQALTQTGAMLGTVGYMAPEQATGSRDVDARADVFALGCVLFECLTGRPAFGGSHAVAVLAKVLTEEAPAVSELRPGLGEAVDVFVARMLAKKPEDRPEDARAVLSGVCALEVAGSAQPSVSRAPEGLTGSERKIVSVILAEPEGADTARTVTPDQAHQELNRIQELAATFHADATPLAGGAVIIVLSGDSAATDQASRAASCALGVQRLQPELRVVLATGWGEISGRFPVGPVIDRAATLLRTPRLDGAVGVDIDDVTAGLLDGRFDVRNDDERHLLRGMREAESPRLLLGKATPCVGRDKELALLSATMDECIGDRVARLVLVTAPPGVGKTRLAAEFLRRVRERDGVRVLTARAEANAVGSAQTLTQKLVLSAAGIRQADPVVAQHAQLRAYLDELLEPAVVERVAEFLAELAIGPAIAEPSLLLRAARSDATIMGEQKRRAVQVWLDAEAAAGPLLLLLEDVHWGDVQTVSYVDEALRRLQNQPLMVLALARPEVHEQFPALRQMGESQEIRLGGLTRRAAERLVSAVLGDDVAAGTIAKIVDQADGNAFYLEELIRSVAEGGGDLPLTVLAMVQSRLERVEPEARRALRAASVFGETFWTGGVTAVMGNGQDASGWLETLSDRELLVPARDSRFAGERQYEFRHALLHEAVNATLTDVDRVQGHLRAGEWLERVGAKEASVVALHFEAAKTPERAVPWLLRAGEAALARCAYQEACGHFTRGLRACENVADDRARRQVELRLQTRLGNALSIAEGGGASGAQRAYSRARELLEQLVMRRTPTSYPQSSGSGDRPSLVAISMRLPNWRSRRCALHKKTSDRVRSSGDIPSSE